MTIPILAIVWFSAAEVVTASARLTASFARHGGLSFGKLYSLNRISMFSISKRLDE